MISLNLLALYLMDRDRERAERVLRVAWLKSPSDYWTLNKLAGVMGKKRLGSPEQMALRRQARLRYLTAAATARPSSVPASTRLGDALLDSGRFEEALDCYRRAIRLRPDADSYRHLGELFRRQKRFGEATDAYRTAIRLQPKNAPPTSSLAQSLKEQNQPQAAECRVSRGPSGWNRTTPIGLLLRLGPLGLKLPRRGDRPVPRVGAPGFRPRAHAGTLSRESLRSTRSSKKVVL